MRRARSRHPATSCWNGPSSRPDRPLPASALAERDVGRFPARASLDRRAHALRRGGPMLYAMLAYHDEGYVKSWSDEEDAALMAELGGVHDRMGREERLGPAARLGATARAVTVRDKGV